MSNPIKKPDMIISPLPLRQGKNVPTPTTAKPQNRFNKILQREVRKQETIRFSAHAEKRLKSRNISINESQRMKLNQAVDTASSKGVKDSLILLNNLAFVVNIKNRIVVTAMEQSQLKEGIVTNIDSTMIIPDSDE